MPYFSSLPFAKKNKSLVYHFLTAKSVNNLAHNVNFTQFYFQGNNSVVYLFNVENNLRSKILMQPWYISNVNEPS